MDQLIELNVSFEVEEATSTESSATFISAAVTEVTTETSTALVVTGDSYGSNSFTILAIVLAVFLVLAIVAIFAVVMFSKKKCSRFGSQGESTLNVKQAEKSDDAKPKPLKSILKANQQNDIKSCAQLSQAVKPKEDKDDDRVSNVASHFKPSHFEQTPRSFFLPGLNTEPLGGSAQPLAAEVNQHNNQPILPATRDEQFEARVALNVRNNALYRREEALVGLVIDGMFDRLDDQLHANQHPHHLANYRGARGPSDRHR